MKRFTILLALALFSTVLPAQISRGGGSGGAGARADTSLGGVRPSQRAMVQRSDTGRRAALTQYIREAPGEVAYSQFLFAPELVMRNQSQINLQDVQRAKITTEMTLAQSRFTEIQWNLSQEEEKLGVLLQTANPGESNVLAQMDRVLTLEQSLKRTQMSLLVRIKNVLNPEQQASLSRLRKAEEGGAAPLGGAVQMRRRGGGAGGE